KQERIALGKAEVEHVGEDARQQERYGNQSAEQLEPVHGAVGLRQPEALEGDDQHRNGERQRRLAGERGEEATDTGEPPGPQLVATEQKEYGHTEQQEERLGVPSKEEERIGMERQADEGDPCHLRCELGGEQVIEEYKCGIETGVCQQQPCHIVSLERTTEEPAETAHQ